MFLAITDTYKFPDEYKWFRVMEGCVVIVTPKNENFSLSFSISVICIIYVITEQAEVLRNRHGVIWILL